MSTSLASSSLPPLFTASGTYPTVSAITQVAFVRQLPVAIAGIESGTTTLLYDEYATGCVTEPQAVPFTTECRPSESGYNIQTYLVSSPTYIAQRSGTTSLGTPSGSEFKFETGSYSFREECRTLDASIISCSNTFSNPLTPGTFTASSTLAKNPQSFNPDDGKIGGGWDWVTLYVTKGAELLASTDRTKSGVIAVATSTEGVGSAPAESADAAHSSSLARASLSPMNDPGAGIFALGIVALVTFLPAVLL